MSNKYTWADAVETAIKQSGYFATLKQIYNIAIPLYETANPSAKGKTHRKTINELVPRHKTFYKILPGLYGLSEHLDKIPIEYQPNDILSENIMEEIVSQEIINTSKVIQQTIRIGQERFRRSLLDNIKSCPITGITDTRILVASHIKPWRVSNNLERLDVNNGFIFSPTIDKLFDIGLITFRNDKTLLISPSLAEEDVISIGIEEKCYPNLPNENKIKYLEYHRNMIYIDKR